MRRPLARLLAPAILAPLLVACVPGAATPQFVTPPPSNATVVVLTSTAPPGGTATPQPPPGTIAPPTTTTGANPPSAAPRTPTPSAGTTPTPGARTTSTPTVLAGTPGTDLPRATKLTADGCCILPRWLPDGGGIAFFAAAGQVGPAAGTYRVPRGGGPPALVSGLYGAFSPDMSVVAYPDGGVTRVARLDGSQLAAIPNEGRRAYLARTNDRVAWMVPAGGVAIVSPSLDPPFQVAILDLASGATVVPPAVFIGESIQWFPDGRRILVNGRDSRAEHPGLWVLDTTTGAVAQIVAGPWLENVAISPDGRQVVYTATLRQDATAGVWLVNADGSGNRKLADVAGGYRWLPDGSGLLVIPAPTARPNDELWRYTPADGARTRLASEEQALFRVAQDDWEVAPDGRAIVYRSATDGAIWTLQFAP